MPDHSINVPQNVFHKLLAHHVRKFFSCSSNCFCELKQITEKCNGIVEYVFPPAQNKFEVCTHFEFETQTVQWHFAIKLEGNFKTGWPVTEECPSYKERKLFANPSAKGNFSSAM